VISLPVTPGAVAPPLSPCQGLTHGGAYQKGTATRPSDVSHRGPQSILPAVPRAVASSNVMGARPVMVRVRAVSLLSPNTATTSAMTITTAKSGV